MTALQTIFSGLVEPLYRDYDIVVTVELIRETCGISISGDPPGSWKTCVVVYLSECTTEYVSSIRTDLESIIPERLLR